MQDIKMVNIKINKRIIGKWNRKNYQILRLLGKGANGIVYLVYDGTKRFALKIGSNDTSLSSELNGLKRCLQAQGNFLGPSLYDIDDWELNGKILPFYVMEYVEGESFPGKNLPLEHVVSQLLLGLAFIHQQGYCYGDLKPTNIIIERKTNQVRIIDYGGMTPFGRSIREFTEWVDRGSWKAGNRKACVQYDLFAIAILILYSIVGKQICTMSNTVRSPERLYDIIHSNLRLTIFSEVLNRAIRGQYQTAMEMHQDWQKKCSFEGIHNYHRSTNFGLIEIGFIGSALLCGCMVWLHFH